VEDFILIWLVADAPILAHPATNSSSNNNNLRTSFDFFLSFSVRMREGISKNQNQNGKSKNGIVQSATAQTDRST
jgi:hypothetical protein